MKILGIDPGVKNTGYCLIDDKLNILESGVEAAGINTVKKFLSFNPDLVVIERFVSYKGTFTDQEKVNRFIGMLEYAFSNKNTIMVRAVEWQIKILKKEGKLPKKFSQQTNVYKKFKAKDYVYRKFNKLLKTEHEADAFLLAYYGFETIGQKSNNVLLVKS